MSAERRLVAGDASLRLALQGAEPRGWCVGGRELLWPAAAPWPKTSPLLFPVVGHLAGGQVRVAGRSYPMGVHGFAAGQEWAQVAGDAASLTLRLQDSAATRAHYPFAFRLELACRLAPRAAILTLTLTNRDPRPLPFALGLHPGFRWPFAGGAPEAYALDFEQPERPEVPMLTAAGLFTSARRPLPLDGARLPLSPELLRDEALVLLNARSRRVRFLAPDGSAIAVEVEDFPHLALWRRAPGQFLCIEAWTGHSDPEGFAGELADKPSMRLLAPGAISRHSMSWRFEEAAG